MQTSPQPVPRSEVQTANRNRATPEGGQPVTERTEPDPLTPVRSLLQTPNQINHHRGWLRAGLGCLSPNDKCAPALGRRGSRRTWLASGHAVDEFSNDVDVSCVAGRFFEQVSNNQRRFVGGSLSWQRASSVCASAMMASTANQVDR